MKEQTRHGLRYLLIGIAIIIAGVALSGFKLSSSLSHLTDGLIQFVAPGRVTIPINKSGAYTIFLEEQSVIDGKIYFTSESVSGLGCTAERQGSEQKIVIRRPAASVTYSIGGRSGHSVLEFDADRQGSYTLACAYPDARKGPEVVLAVGTGLGEKIGSMVSSSLAAMFGGGAIGAVFLFLARREWKKPNQMTSVG